MLDMSNAIYHTNVSSYNNNNINKNCIREAIKLPDFSNEPCDTYICSLKPESPFDSVTILGLNFDKRTISADYSYASNQVSGKLPKEKVILRSLPVKLVDMIKKRATEVLIEIPPKQESEGGYSLPYNVKASDYIIIEMLNKPPVQEVKPVEGVDKDGKETEKGKKRN
jgi:hypothetical protein